MGRVARWWGWVLAVACVAAVVASCTTSVRGTAGPVDLGDGESVDPDSYEFPPDGSGFGRGAVDQPMAVPGFNWEGWEKESAGRCAWVPKGLFDRFAAGAPQAVGHFCSFFTAEGSTIQVRWGSTYGPFLYDPLAFMEPAQIAGLEARVYDLAGNQQVYPGSCQAEVNTRSMSGLNVLHWNEKKQPLDKEQSCAKAKQVAEVIARRMVPLAGGKVWLATPQKPDPSLVGDRACVVVDDLVTLAAGIEIGDENHEEGTSDLGTTCSAKRKDKLATALLTPGPDRGLAQVLPAPGTREEKAMKIGPLPARKEVLARSCAVAVEFVPGRLLRIEYSHDTDATGGCLAAREMVMAAVENLIEKTS